MNAEPRAERLLEQARVLLEVGRFEEAARLLSTVLGSDPDNGDACVLLSVALRRDEPRRSLELARRAVALRPSDPNRHVNLAWAADADRSAAEARDAAREAVRLAPYWPDGHQALAQILAGQGKHLREAKNAAQAAVRIAPHDVRTWIALGNVSLAQAMYFDAERCYREALRIDPSNLVAQANLALIMQETGRLAVASSLLHQIIRLDPSDPAARGRIDGLLIRFMTHVLVLAAAFGAMLAIVVHELRF